MIKLLALSGIVYAAVLIDRKRRRVAGAGDTMSMPPDVAVMDADVIIGITEVDPEPLSSVLEAMDPDATEGAHRDVQDQRDRMPVGGKNIP